MHASPASYVSPLAPREFSASWAWKAWGCAAVLALLWMGLIVGAPLAASGGHEASAFVIYQGLKTVCHQMAERAFWVAGHPLAVCARCFGIYAGFTVAVLLYPLAARGWRRATAFTATPRREWLVLALAPTTIDFTLGITGVWANTHSSRALTGAWLGAWLAAYVVPGVLEIFRQRRQRRNRQRTAHDAATPTTTPATVVFERK
ncbi:MAG TPA: DUF2085 domain-containing protein [Pyrinomonadaceae bacterium]|nr:DUF2085 domain-containing protein [Pyrinomonadaceae bacterium]